MQKRIVVIGAGFAGMWSALAAARLLDQHDVSCDEIEVVMIAPEPMLVVRPRLYEDVPGKMAVPLLGLFDATGIRFVAGTVDRIDTVAREVGIVSPSGESRATLSYDGLVLASGSRLVRPDIPGLLEHTFSIDQIEEAVELDQHLHALVQQPKSEARNTVVVAGGGFTGIEIAAELPSRLRRILGPAASVRVIVVEKAADIGPDLGPGPRPVIETALSELGVECRLGVSAARFDAQGVVLSNGERIDAQTVVWTAGVRASNLTQQLPAERDRLGRVLVEDDLRVPSLAEVFATGDTACAATDDEGHTTMMSCQHALEMGRFAGNNVAATLLGQPTLPYRQTRYGTGLDLGPWGAVHTTGWDRQIIMQGAESKARKQWVNSIYIYPPLADRTTAFEAADPLGKRGGK
ncbi:pyridine nucleotide-disulfide oxidoreductase [Pandoraea aquatica]|uniref:Pyridine nucleotide-disulfide oxidoreductase n=1 Tax=Pandoraea aquatica TaxID=2508290 RepID=A0A5E4RLS8_9BURK|nr:NAD(P)/FAD-dependent oxidoreductase [Pandoraea aquatica]VVD64257.1 pyridine nucleotide-disulfide oxidoreductase [Pandoraea aquatica]